jgi:glutamyl-tRNA synthetase
MQYLEEGYLPEALLNYLARLGWGHGDAELFTREQFVEWFSLGAVSRSPAKFDPEKLKWMNAQYIRQADAARIAGLAMPFFRAMECDAAHGPDVLAVVALFKDRANTIKELVQGAAYFYKRVPASAELRAQYYTADILPAMKALREKLASIDWNRQALNAAIKDVLAACSLKMPKLAMPLRVMLAGTAHTPSIDAVLELLGRTEVLQRLDSELPQYPA